MGVRTPLEDSRRSETKFPAENESRSFMATHLVPFLSQIGWVRVPEPARSLFSMSRCGNIYSAYVRLTPKWKLGNYTPPNP